MFVVMKNVVQLQKPDKKCRSKYELFICVRKCDECFECGWKIFKTVSMVTMVYWPLNLFDLNLWGTRNTTIVTCIRWILVNMVRLNKDTEIEMSIAISNGQTKAVIMRINEFTQVTHDEREKKVSAHTRTTQDAVTKSERESEVRMSQMQLCQISCFNEICSRSSR